MSMEKEFRELQKSAATMRDHDDGIEKNAFDLMSLINNPFMHNWAIPTVIGDSVMSGLKRFGRKEAPTFLRSGIELGREGKKTSPYVSDFLQTALGKGTTAPLIKGEEIGQFMREKGMDDGKSNRLLQRLSGINGVHRKRLEREHILRGELDKMPQDTVGDALHRMLHGEQKTSTNPLAQIGHRVGDLVDKGVNKTITGTATNADAKRHIGHDLAQLPYVVPGAAWGDTRIAIRPIMRRIDGTKLGDVAGKLDKTILTTPVINKAAPVYNRFKRYVDE
jgi:hypothetical protein